MKGHDTHERETKKKNTDFERKYAPVHIVTKEKKICPKIVIS